MQALMSLNDLYMQFIAGLLSKKELEGFIFRTIHENLCHYNLAHWKRDDCDDFLAWLYPRISRAIDSYHNNGASFDNYIAGMVRWSAKEYRSCIADNNVFEYAVWMARFSDQYAEEQEPGYNVEEPVSATAIEQTKNPRQLLMLILKCYNCVSDDFLERIAPRLGIDKDTLKQMIRKMEELRLERDQVICSIRERIHNQFYRCIVYEKRLAAMPENSACAMRMKAQLDRARQRLASMRKRYAGMRPGATNGQVAQILGLTKGAVDANLYALKTKWNNDPHKSMLN